jgi:succinate-acetate transporter protein
MAMSTLEMIRHEAPPTVRVVSTIADPAPLGLAAFALSTFVLSIFNAELAPAAAEGVVLGLALFYGGLVQVAAGLWELAKGNAFGGTAFCSYGAFWMALWYLTAFADLSAAGPDAAKGVGVFLLGWTIFTIYMTVAAWRTTKALFAVFVVLTLTFVCLTAADLGGMPGLTVIGGWLGILTSLGAWYCAAAGVLNATWGRTVLEVGPRH